MAKNKAKKIRVCETCGAPLIFAKDKIYTVTIRISMLTAGDEHSAIDCDVCGCQNILSIRYPKKEEKR